MARRTDRITIRFNGYLYQKYSDRPYFERVGGHHFLHRDIWEFHNGPIPAGYQIHHIDGNKTNNALENLEILSAKEHRVAHKDDANAPGRRPEQKAHLERIRPLAAEWHSSEEGRAWHREHAKQTLRKPGAPKPFSKVVPVEKTCAICGVVFISRNPKQQTVCSLFRLRCYRKTKRLQDHPIQSCGTDNPF